jgi:hypothetical protein
MARNPSNPRRDSGDVPPSPRDQPASSNEKSNLNKPSFWVAVITLIVVSGYTYFAHQQVTETQTANSIAKKALAEVNKPYVMSSGLNPNRTEDINGLHLRGWVSH